MNFIFLNRSLFYTLPQRELLRPSNINQPPIEVMLKPAINSMLWCRWFIHIFQYVVLDWERERGAKHWSDFRILLRLLFFLRLHSFLFFWSLSLHHFLFVIVHCKNNQFVIACKAVYYLFLLGVLFGFGFYSSFLFAAIILLELVGRTNKKSVWWWNSRQ